MIFPPLYYNYHLLFNSFCCILLFFSATSCKQSYTADILIENVNIIDVETGEIMTNRDVLITSNRIEKILEHGHNTIHSKMVIDGSTKYLIPGLWDMHEHMMFANWYSSQMPLLRANGITGFREMYGEHSTVNHVRSQIEKDCLPYFRFVASGHIVDGKKPFWEGSIPVATVDRAIHIVDSLKNTKAEFVKVYSFLTADVFFAIAKRCKEKRVPFSGHVPNTVWVTEASDAGMSSMEHLYGFLAEACSNSDSAMALMQQMARAADDGNTEERKRASLLFYSLVLNNFSKEKMRSIAKTLKKNNTHIVPTLVTLRGQYFSNDTSFTNDPRLTYMSKETLDYWKATTDNDIKKNSEVDWQNKRKTWQITQEIMNILISEKVLIMAGTDADNPYAFPGFSLHDELDLYVASGMDPIEAIRSATIIPAKFLQMNDSIGTIEEGKLADIVLLDANPLNNIKNTTKVHTIIANGKLYGKNYVDSILKR